MAVLYIDVREPEEFAHGHVKGAINLPLDDLIRNPDVTKDVPKNEDLVVYCRTGNRSQLAVQILRQRGYTNVVNGINQENIGLDPKSV